MISGIIAALEASGLLVKVAVIGGLMIAMGVTYGVWHHEVYQSGVNDTIASIARADAKTVDRALKARAVLQQCQSSGKQWDQSTGECK